MSQEKETPDNAVATTSDTLPILVDIPPLSTYPAVTEEDRIGALRLVADSVAQQRQIAAKSIIFHPLALAVMIVPLAAVYKILYKDRSDLPLIFTTSAGIVMAGLILVRLLTSGYIELAEKTGSWTWLHEGRREQSEEDLVLVTKFGNEIIGALVMREALTQVRNGRKHSRTVGSIRAWTVKQRYRRKEIGTALLEEAVALCKAKRWDGPLFDEKHANSVRILPHMFNSRFERMEKLAREALDKVVKQAKGKR